MTEHNRLQYRSVIVAAVTATIMMFVFGTAYRALASRLVSSEGISSMSPDALEKLPMQIGEWIGQDEPLGEAVIEATDTDAHISRRYSRYNALEQIRLYIAAGKRARDLMPHRPEVCYAGAGWSLISSDTIELPLDDGIVLPCSVFQFSKGVLNTMKVIILDYYIVDGQFYRDISLLRSKIWRGSGAVDYVAQIQILAEISANQTADSAAKMISDFAVQSAWPTFQVLEDVANNKDGDAKELDSEDISGDLASD